MPVLSLSDQDLINANATHPANIINSIQGCLNGSTTSYKYNGFTVYHYTNEETFFYSYNHANPANAANAVLLGIGRHRGNNGNTYRLDVMCGGRNCRTVNIGGRVSEWNENS